MEVTHTHTFFHSAHLTIAKLLSFIFVLICTENNINKLISNIKMISDV